MTNVILDRTGAPSSVWLLALMYVAFVLNHTWSDNIKNVGVVAGLVKVANGQTDRLARIFVAQ